jgi:voltage-gated potassium channel
MAKKDTPSLGDPFDSLQQLSFNRKLWLIVQYVFRTIFGVAVILVVLFLVPDDLEFNAVVPYVVFGGVAVFFVWFFARQLRDVRHSHFPFLRAIEGLILTGMLYLAAFSGIYVMISGSDPQSFNQPLDHFTALYYAMVVFSTVGFGEIAPIDVTARSISMLQMVLNLVFLGVALKVLFNAAQRSQAIGAALSRRKVVKKPVRKTQAGSRRSRPPARSRSVASKT